MNLSEKVSYLIGLMDGFEIDETTKEGKVLRGLTEAMKELVGQVADNSERIDDIMELTDSLDFDLGELEETVYEIEDSLEELAEIMSECDCDLDDEDDCCSCGDIHHTTNRKLNKHGQIYEIVCPSCNNELLLDEKDLKFGKMNCPECNELLEFEITD